MDKDRNWQFSKIVELDENGQLLLLEDNLKHFLIGLNSDEQSQITFVGFLGNSTEENTFFANLLSEYLQNNISEDNKKFDQDLFQLHNATMTVMNLGNYDYQQFGPQLQRKISRFLESAEDISTEIANIKPELLSHQKECKSCNENPAEEMKILAERMKKLVTIKNLADGRQSNVKGHEMNLGGNSECFGTLRDGIYMWPEWIRLGGGTHLVGILHVHSQLDNMEPDNPLNILLGIMCSVVIDIESNNQSVMSTMKTSNWKYSTLTNQICDNIIYITHNPISTGKSEEETDNKFLFANDFYKDFFTSGSPEFIKRNCEKFVPFLARIADGLVKTDMPFCISQNLVEHFRSLMSKINSCSNRLLEDIPAEIIIDTYSKLAEKGDVNRLKEEMSGLTVFIKLVRCFPLRDKLLELFKTVINREIEQALTINNNDGGTELPPCYRNLVLDLLPGRLAANFEAKALKESKTEELRENLIGIGMELGEFFCEAGWYEEASKVLTQCIAGNQLEHHYKRSIKCMEKLLGAQVSYSILSQARITYETANALIKKLEEASIPVNLSGIYSVFSGLCYLEGNYNQALEWSVKALEQLQKYYQRSSSPLEPSSIIDILRQSAKSCVAKREFHKAELLIKEAVYLSREVYGSKSMKYADALLDYGYYLLNRDLVQQAVSVYQECLQIRKEAYGQYNLMTAVVKEDLSYAIYVKEYSVGNFDEARALSQEALHIMEVLLPPNHLQLASAKRIKALILEEIAIDSHSAPMENELLKEVETLHLEALRLSKQVFGEMNVQTAKHYGNLGRLYQSMRKYSDAEQMHLKAISIKEALLGRYDFEVALSLGHLASLYNYDMEQYRKAEELHLRSISIGKRLFGEAYSGLEYDYRGLIQIYKVEGNQEKLNEYEKIFSEWKKLRDLKAGQSEAPVADKQTSRSIEKVLEEFFNMQWTNLDNQKANRSDD